MSEIDTRPAVPAKAGDWVELRGGGVVGPLCDSGGGLVYPLAFDRLRWTREGAASATRAFHELDIVAIVPRPDSPPQPKPQPDAVEHPSLYHRTFHGVTLDLYRVANAWGVTSHPLFHALKKIMLAGERGPKSRETDLREAIVAIQEELKIMNEEAANGPH